MSFSAFGHNSRPIAPLVVHITSIVHSILGSTYFSFGKFGIPTANRPVGHGSSRYDSGLCRRQHGFNSKEWPSGIFVVTLRRGMYRRSSRPPRACGGDDGQREARPLPPKKHLSWGFLVAPRDRSSHLSAAISLGRGHLDPSLFHRSSRQRSFEGLAIPRPMRCCRGRPLQDSIISAHRIKHNQHTILCGRDAALACLLA